jgi:DNA-binding HxlR family transcriptional regulator
MADLTEQLQELRVMHKLSIINDLEYERRKYNLLHPEAPKQAKSDQGQALTSQEILALQLKELRDMHKLSVITDEEYDRRHYILLHPESTQAASTKDDNESTPQEILALQLKELRDMHKLSVITDEEYERRKFALLHP